MSLLPVVNMTSEVGGLTPLVVRPHRDCVDIVGKSIPHGFLFTPGPDKCLVCTCFNGEAGLCQTVLCSPPPNCQSLRVGNQCCQWICLDDIHPHGGSDFDPHDVVGVSGGVVDVKLRLMASAVLAVFSLALVTFLVYRLRQQRLRQARRMRRGREDAVSLSSLRGGPGWPRSSWHQWAWWKPSQDGDLFEQRPAPPSYDDAMQLGGGQPENDSLGGSSSSGSEAPPYSEIHLDPIIPEPCEWYRQQNRAAPTPSFSASARPSTIPGAALVLPQPAPISPRLHHVATPEPGPSPPPGERAQLPKVIRRMRARSREGIVIPSHSRAPRLSLQLPVSRPTTPAAASGPPPTQIQVTTHEVPL